MEKVRYKRQIDNIKKVLFKNIINPEWQTRQFFLTTLTILDRNFEINKDRLISYLKNFH